MSSQRVVTKRLLSPMTLVPMTESTVAGSQDSCLVIDFIAARLDYRHASELPSVSDAHELPSRRCIVPCTIAFGRLASLPSKHLRHAAHAIVTPRC